MKQNLQEFAQKFVSALNQNDLATCYEMLQQLEGEPTLRHWFLYFKSIMDYETEHDSSATQKALLNLSTKKHAPFFNGKVLIALARISFDQGDWMEAIKHCEDSLAYFVDSPGELARVYRNIAHVYLKGFNQGDLGYDALLRAQKLGEDAQDLFGSIANLSEADPQLESFILTTLGTVHMNLNLLDDALDYYRANLRIKEQINSDLGMGSAFLNIGEVYERQENYSDALQQYQKALAKFETAPNQLARIADVLANLGHLYHAMGQKNEALTHYRKAVTQIETLRARNESEATRVGFFSTVSDIYAHLIALCIDEGYLAEAFGYVERSQARTFLDMLNIRVPEMPLNDEAMPLTLSQVQFGLPHDSILLEYYSAGLVEHGLQDMPKRVDAHHHRFPKEKIWLFAITRQSIQVFDTELSPNLLLQQRSGALERRNFWRPKMRRVLYQKLVSPAAHLLEGKSTIFIAPHGPLHYISFQSLLVSPQKTFFEEWEAQMVYTPSASVLFQNSQTHKVVEVPTRSTLAIGFNGSDGQRLPFAEGEARQIANQAAGHALQGADANVEAITKLAPQFHRLHFACHGSFNPESPLDSFLMIGEDESLSGLDIMHNLQLKCELVTLSACESGINQIRRGDELIGLTRAFLHAGAKSLIASLWRVNGPSTRILMEKLYQEIDRGKAAAEALTVAQHYLMRLTYDEGHEILVRFFREEQLAANDDDLGQQATALLEEMNTGQASERHQAEPLEQAPRKLGERLIFASPYYWAPFILISADSKH
ncbi:MAG: CHAT domain-containing tetratricopeptide repeat protein [Chloroflexota bacterium]